MNLNDLNWKTWGLALALALGGTVELMKRLPSSKAWDQDNLRTPKFQPYAARGKGQLNRNQPPAFLPAMGAPAMVKPAPSKFVPPVMTKDQVAALVAHQNKPGQAEAEHGADAKKKKLDESEWEIVVDPKTGKRIKRKKKKVEAKKEEEKKEEPKKIAEEPKDDGDQKSDSDADIDRAISANLNTGRLSPLPRPRADDAFNSAEEWMKRLLARPNLAETNRFIDHFRKNLVTADVFYKVIKAMLDDSRPEMKKLAVLALAATPTYPMSFQLLVDASTNQKHDNTVRAKATEALNPYGTEISRLGVLDKIIKGGATVNATYVALVKLEESAQKNLGAQQSAQQANPSVAQARVASYQRFTTQLGNLSRTAPDARVKQQAGQTLATLQSLISAASTTASQPAPQQPAS